MASELKVLSCKDHDPSCDFEVRDTNEEEIILAAQAHAKRVHGMDIPADDIRPMIKTKSCCG